MDELSKVRKWRRWLAIAAEEASRLRSDHRIYQEIRAHLAGNPEWTEWAQCLYLVGVSLAVRRLADANPRHRTVSLNKLLTDMQAHADCLTRRNILRWAGTEQRNDVNRLFDRLAGEGAAVLPREVIEQWRKRFGVQAAPFREWVDHRVAHYDLRVGCPPPSDEQVESILSLLDDLCAMLRTLLGA